MGGRFCENICVRDACVESTASVVLCGNDHGTPDKDRANVRSHFLKDRVGDGFGPFSTGKPLFPRVEATWGSVLPARPKRIANKNCTNSFLHCILHA